MSKCWQGHTVTGALTHQWWGCKVVPFWKTTWQFLEHLNIELPCDPAIPLLGMYPGEMKTYVHKNTYSPPRVSIPQGLCSRTSKDTKIWGCPSLLYEEKGEVSPLCPQDMCAHIFIAALSILKEINHEYSLEGLLLILELQHFDHLIQRPDSLESTLMLGKIEDKRRRGWQKMRWLDSTTHSMDMNLSKLQEIVKDRKGWCAAVYGIAKSQTQLSNNTTCWINKILSILGQVKYLLKLICFCLFFTVTRKFTFKIEV